VIAELYSESETGDQIDYEYRINLNGVATEDFIEHPHAAHEFEHDEEHTQTDDAGDTQATDDLQREHYSGNSQ